MNCDLLPLFHPNSIAIIGASADDTKYSSRVVEVLHTLNFPGRIFLINPKTNAIPGKQVFATVLDISETIDLAILFVPAGLVPSALEDCAKKGVKVAIVHGAGFAELGEDGRVQQEAIAKTAHSSGMRIVGPNCMGIASPASGINMVTTQAPRVDQGGLAFAGQSGWATEYALVMGTERGMGFSNVVSCGNQADLNISDYLDYFGRDPDTRIIGAYVEGFKDGRRFFDSAKDAARHKPVVIWKSGLTSSGARFTQSHTGSLAGNGEMAKAVLNQVGVTEAIGIEDMMDAIVAFNTPYLPQGKRVGVIVSTGGIGVAACDACEAAGLDVPSLPPDVHQEMIDFLKHYLPPFAGSSNPIDLVWAPRGKKIEICRRCVELMAPWVDTVLFGIYPEGDSPEKYADFLGTMSRKIEKPILSVPPYGHVMQPFLQLSTRCGVPSFTSVERTVKALTHLIRRAEWLKETDA
ncbi:MAG: CoA-binding protein [Deltaproteobacteria bacterium]|nr:CoA-binding protein [Deltaproteobacteria bacterium]